MILYLYSLMESFESECSYTRFQRIIREAKLKYIRLHNLRHTHTTLILKAGVHPKIVSEKLGHANIGITLDIYSHLPGMQEAAAWSLTGF